MEEFCKKQANEDTVEYCIYHKESISQPDIAKHELKRLLIECQAFVAKETHGYIWQNQPFCLIYTTKDSVPCLWGSTNFGDFIDDEWFVVYLIFKLTEKFPELVASVHDNDGQFLLIEAAENLPKWISPDTSFNRVFINRGMLHLVLKPQTPAEIAVIPVTPPSIQQSLFAVSNSPWITQASSKILAAVQNRIDGFPGKALQNIFHANVYVNKKVVYILDAHPELIAACVQAFYLRDPIDLRVCRQFHHFPPEDRVWTTIPMTRCQYAQLEQQHFIPDQRSGYRLSGTLPSTQRKGYDLGMKICHGFEILCSKVKSQLDVDSDSNMVDKRQHERYIAALKRIGYFQNEVEGSKLYQKLLADATRYISSAKENPNVQDSSSCQTVKMLKQIELKQPELVNLKIHAVDNIPNQEADDWMYLDDNDVNKLVKDMNEGFEKLRKSKKSKNNSKTDLDGETELLNSVKKVEKFVESESGLEGVEVKDNSVKLETSSFMDSLSKMLDLCMDLNSTTANAESDSDEFLSSAESSLSDNDDEALQDSGYQTSRDMRHYMQQMDSELAQTEMGKSFKQNVPESSKNADQQKDNSINEPVNIDLNLAENFLQGIKHEAALSGPVSNVLGSLGVKLENLDLVS
uniref:HsignallingT1 protein n=1 Tax=Phallusia mammillata TaxID=59560 RepID=A0A6F9DCC1_9ASCI|nr:HsignallingT1 protein [Phallusia mammillata]